MEDLGDDDELARALQMSMDQSASSSAQDPKFMSSVLGSLPGVDPNDPRIKDALKDMDKKSSDPKSPKKSPKK
jgi:26S proteasome regulatory subunit N10